MKIPDLNIECWDFGNGLWLVCDSNAPDFDSSWALIERQPPESADYERWWEEARRRLIKTDPRVLRIVVAAVELVEWLPPVGTHNIPSNNLRASLGLLR